MGAARVLGHDRPTRRRTSAAAAEEVAEVADGGNFAPTT